MIKVQSSSVKIVKNENFKQPITSVSNVSSKEKFTKSSDATETQMLDHSHLHLIGLKNQSIHSKPKKLWHAKVVAKVGSQSIDNKEICAAFKYQKN